MVIIRPGTTLSALGFPGMEASIKGSGNTVQAPRIKFLRFIKFIGMAFLVLLGLKGFATHQGMYQAMHTVVMGGHLFD